MNANRVSKAYRFLPIKWKENANNLLTRALDRQTCCDTLQSCIKSGALKQGKTLHALVIKSGFSPETYLDTKLLILYTKLRLITDARQLFDEMRHKNAVSWAAMISAYSKYEHWDEAYALYKKLCEEEPSTCMDQYVFTSVLPACGALGSLNHLREVCEDIRNCGFESDVFVGSSVIDAFVKCGSLEEAHQVFDKMPERNAITWTRIISGYVQEGLVDEALTLFNSMPCKDLISWNVMVSGYAQLGMVEEALGIFRRMPERDLFSWNSMLFAFSQKGFVHKACKFFWTMPHRNEVSWNTLIIANSKNGNSKEALALHRKMREVGDCSPDLLTFATVSEACGHLGCLNYGNGIHADVIKFGFSKNVEVQLIEMYANCGGMEHATRIFDNRNTDVFNIQHWNAMIWGYVRNGCFDKALGCFAEMEGSPNLNTLVNVLSACSNLSLLENGKGVHSCIIKSGFDSDIFVGSRLVDMYSKCGTVEDAQTVFEEMSTRDVVLWTAIINGYAINGLGNTAIQLLEQMIESDILPNHITFLGILSACCYSGLLSEGCSYFDSMTNKFNIVPQLEHYCCMVHLFCRAGKLQDAFDFVCNRMPMKADAAVWAALLAGCKTHGDIELSKRVADQLFQTDGKSAAHYVLLSNIYAESGRWEELESIRKIMKEKKIEMKRPGCSWIEIHGKIHNFMVGDSSHPCMQQINEKLTCLLGLLKEADYMPRKNAALRDVEEEHKDEIVGHHSEKLALSFGLLKLPSGLPIRIVKNLRICQDCHSAIKLISKIVERKIIVRDVVCFHHFEGGLCSCGDYW